MKSTLEKIIKIPITELPNKVVAKLKREVLGCPQHIILQTVSACNLSCEHCFITYYGDEIKDGKIKILKYNDCLKRIKYLKNAIAKAKYFQFSTFEPLMHKNIFKMMEDVLEINSQIQFPIHSNGQIISNKLIKKLVQFPISEVTISLDGINKQTVEAFKTGASFERIIQSIKEVAKTDLRSKLGTVFVLHKNNYTELVEYVDYVNMLGVKTIYVNNLLSFTNRHESDYLYSYNDNPRVNKIFDEVINKIKNNGQTIHLPKMKPDPIGCTASEMLYIDIDGNVAPCDFLGVSTPFHFLGINKIASPVFFGNINHSEPLSVYKSKEFTKFRKMHRKQNIPSSCTHCIDAYGLMCSKRTIYS